MMTELDPQGLTPSVFINLTHGLALERDPRDLDSPSLHNQYTGGVMELDPQGLTPSLFPCLTLGLQVSPASYVAMTLFMDI